MARTLLFLWILVPVTGKWCNVDGSKCRGRWNELERFFPLNLANDWYGFSYPVDWDGDGRVDVIHAETNYSRVPDGPHGLDFTALLRYDQRQVDGSLLRQSHEPDGVEVLMGFVDFADWEGTGAGLICCHQGSNGYELVWAPKERLQAANSCGAAAAEVLVRTGTSCHAPRAVDFDHDGDLDLLLPEPGGIYLYERLPEGLAPKQLLLALSPERYEYTNYTSVDAADWDGDGDLDLMVSTKARYMYFEQLKSGRFLRLTGRDAPGQLTWDLLAATFATTRAVDWDGDGLLDLFTCSRSGTYSTDSCSMYQRRAGWMGKELDQSPFAFVNVPCGFDMHLADWNSMNRLDLLVDSCDGLKLFPRLSDGRLSTTFMTLKHGCPYRRVFIKDWDNDGRMDILCASEEPEPNYTVLISRQLVNFHFGEPEWLADLPEEVSDVADWNGDGKLDFIMMSGVALQGAPHIFDMLQLNFTGSYLKAVDWNGDGILDLMKLGDGRATPLIRRSGLSDLRAEPDIDNIEGLKPRFVNTLPPVAFADWDGDDQVEIITGHINGDRLTFFSLRMWSTGCEPVSACSLRGVCHKGTSTCQCYQGQSHEVGDCSTCAAGFHTNVTRFGEECVPCPGGSGVCDGRGKCFDDVLARETAGGAFPVPRGNGSCTCYDAAFSGVDRGRKACSVGSCGAGHQEVGGHCILDQLYVLMAFLLGCCFLGIFSLLPFVLGMSIPLEDISLDGGVLVVTTATPHFLLQRPWVSPKVQCLDTSHPVMASQFLARPVPSHPNRLVLMTSPGKDCQQRVDASKGWLRVDRCRAAFCFGYLVPFGLVWTILAAAALSIYVAFEPARDHCIAVVVCAALLALLQHWWCSRIQKSLDLVLAEFKQELSATKPRPCTRGAERAITIQQLLAFKEKFNIFIRDRNMYYVVANLLMPLTRPEQLSYAEVAGPSKVEWFVSHFWGNSFADLVQAMNHHSRQNASEDQAFWICSFSNNQWEIAEELSSECESSSFFLAIQSPSCRGTCLVLDEQVRALSRSWCLFEVLQTRKLSLERDSDYHGLVFCTNSGVLGHGSGMDTALQVAQRLTTLRLEDASASSAEDKEMIDARVRSSSGGFEATNGFVRMALREALEQAQGSFENDLSKVVGALAAHQNHPY